MLHCIPFLVGAAAGAAITYIAKDRSARDSIKAGADGIVDGVKEGFERATRAAKVLTRPSTERSDREASPDSLATTQ
jgi:uncharacterized membrane protein